MLNFLKKSQSQRNAQLFLLLLAVFSFASYAGIIDISKSTPNSSVTLDFSVKAAESWDAKNKPKNVVSNCINGARITGFEYSNIRLQTFGGSFLNEAVIGFSSSDPNDAGIQLVVGIGRNEAGTGIFSSNGIIDLTDNGNDDVISGNDNKFIMQFYEEVDDLQDAIDAKFTDGTLKVWGVDLVADDSCEFIAGENSTDLSISYTEIVAKDNKTSANDKYATVGDSLSLAIVVKNHTGYTAADVVLNNTLSDKLQFESLSCDDGTAVNTANAIAHVNVQDIGSFASLRCTLKAQVLSEGDITNSASVNASNDNVSSNNSATLVIAGTPAVVSVPMLNIWFLVLLMVCLLFIAYKYNPNIRH